MANANSLIQSTVTSGSPQVTIQGFGDILVMLSDTDAPGYGVNEVRTYATTTAIDADGPAPGNGDLTAQGVTNLKAALNQEIRPVQVKGGQYVELNDINTELVAVQLIDDDWYGLLVTGANAHDNVNILLIAAFAEGRSKPTLYFATSAEATVKDDTAGNTFEDLVALAYKRTAYFYHDPVTEPMVISSMAKFLAINPDTGTTIVAWQLITGVTKQLQLTETELLTNLLNKGANVYTEVRGLGSVQKGKLVSGEFIDIQLTKDWLKERVAEDFAQAASDFTANGSKIPFDDGGIAVTDNLLETRLDQAVDAKHLDRRAPGTNGIADLGSPFVIDLSIVDVIGADKDNRIIRREYGGTLTGAIQEANFQGTVATS